ncbi:hypothetical protein GQ457_12G008750 [Hibiscus cannabinus]
MLHKAAARPIPFFANLSARWLPSLGTCLTRHSIFLHISKQDNTKGLNTAGHKWGFIIQSTANMLSVSTSSLYFLAHKEITNNEHASLIAKISAEVASVNPTDLENVIKHLALLLRRQPPIPASPKLPETAPSVLNFSSPLSG